MIKRGWLLFILLIIGAGIIIIPDVYSQSLNDFNDYSSLKIGITVNNSFYVTTANSQIDFISANLSFFPKTEDAQKVESLNIDSIPLSSIKSYDKTNIPFYWQNPTSLNYYLAVDSVVSITNAIIPIDRKIIFPITKIDNQFTKPTEKIDVNEDIRNKAQELAAGEDDLFVLSFKVAEWVETNVKYDLTSLTSEAVQKSSWVMASREGVCDELTNLFISMMRSLGIPTRYISGLAYSNIKHAWGPHAWAEVYFPDKGWIPFDVTYRQFGWVDPSHVKLKTSLDSGESSIKYLWKGNGLDIKVNKINVNANLVELGEKLKNGPVILKARALANNVGPGSYVPIEVSVENTQQFYVPETISVVKAPELEGSNIKAVLLKPGEVKKLYWVMKIPTDLDPSYVYTTTFEAEDSFHEAVSTNISYNFNGDIYSKEGAMKFAEVVDNKIYSKDLELKCDHPSYAYSYEDFLIKCTVSNKGNVPLDNLRICLAQDCKVTRLGISEESYPSFVLKGLQQGRTNVEVLASNSEISASYRVSFNILENPDLTIEQFSYSPAVVYGSDLEIDALFVVKAPVNDLKLYVDDYHIATISTLDSSKRASIKMSSTNLKRFDSFNLKMTFKDKNSRDYTINKTYTLTITNVPWYVKLFRWLAG